MAKKTKTFSGKGNLCTSYTGFIRVTYDDAISADILANQTKVDLEIGLKCSDGNWYSQHGTYLSMVVDDTERLTSDEKYQQRTSVPNGEVVFVKKTGIIIKHDDDGKKTLKVSGYVETKSGDSYTPGRCNISGSLALPDIPRASAFGTITGDTIGSSIVINITRKVSTFTHKLSFDFGSLKGQSIASAAGTSASFTPNMNLCNEIPNSETGQMTLYLETYSGATKIGNTVTKVITLKVPDSVIPTIGGISVSEAVANVKTKAGVYVQSLSKLNLGITNPLGAYGSTIKSYLIKFENVNYPQQTAVSNIVQGSGNLIATAEVTDSRGRKSELKQMTIAVVAYSPPKFAKAPSAVRQSSTTSNVDVTMSGSVSSVKNVTTEKNILKVYVLYKLFTASTYPALSETYRVPTTGLAFTNLLKTLTGIDASKSYDIKVVIQDNFKEVSWELSLSTEVVIGDINRNGWGIKKRWEKGALDVGGDGYLSGLLEANIIQSLTDIYVAKGSNNEGKIIFASADGARGSYFFGGSNTADASIGAYDPQDGRIWRYLKNSKTLNIGKNTTIDGTLKAQDVLCFQQQLGNTEDLNNLTATGIYHQAQNTNIDVATRHYPATQAGNLIVVNSNSNMIYQTYHTYHNEFYIRIKYLENWTAWVRLDDFSWASITGKPTIPPLARTVKLLWSGNIQSGTATLNEALTNYRYLLVKIGTSSSVYATPVMIPMLGTPSTLRGVGGYETPNYLEWYGINGTISGTTVTLTETWRHFSDTSKNAERLYLREIYGVR